MPWFHESVAPASLAGAALRKIAWPDHPYGTALDGTAESVKALTREDMFDAKARVMAQAAEQVRPGADPLAFLRMPDFFGDLVDDQRFVTSYRRWLDALHTTGARATVTACLGDSDTQP